MPASVTTSTVIPILESSVKPYSQLKHIDLGVSDSGWMKQRVENVSHLSGYTTYVHLEEQVSPIKPPQEVIIIKKPLSPTDDDCGQNVPPSDQELVKTRTVVNYIIIMGVTLAFVMMALIIGIVSLVFSLQPNIPTGTILSYSGNAATFLNNDNQWLFCNGSAVSRTKYSGLFLVIGTIYGAGNGVDTFNLPDLRSRFLWGSSGTHDTVLISGGAATQILSVAQMPVHSHNPGSLATATDGAHTHSYTQTSHNHGGSTGTGSHPWSTSLVASGSSISAYTSIATQSHSISSDNVNIVIQTAGSHTHTMTGATATEGQGQSLDMMPPYQTIHYIIRI